jgi:hypothetical protein
VLCFSWWFLASDGRCLVWANHWVEKAQTFRIASFLSVNCTQQLKKTKRKVRFKALAATFGKLLLLIPLACARQVPNRCTRTNHRILDRIEDDTCERPWLRTNELYCVSSNRSLTLIQTYICTDLESPWFIDSRSIISFKKHCFPLKI